MPTHSEDRRRYNKNLFMTLIGYQNMSGLNFGVFQSNLD